VDEYRRRVVDNELDELMPGVPAIAIEGARAVGKTETATTRSTTVFKLDEPSGVAALSADPGRVSTLPKPVLIDEWQRAPGTWDVVRRAVDQDTTGGQFLLTGSVSPDTPSTHTGAGRIVTVRMRPMSLAERGVGTPTVSLAELMSGTRSGLDGDTGVVADEYAHEIVASGFPGLRDKPSRAIRAQLEGYVDRVVDRDFRDLAGYAIRNRPALRRWMAAYACAVSATTSYEKVRDAATAGHAEKPTKVTVLHWIDTLERLWVAEPVPAWDPARNDLKRHALSPRHQMVDPAIAAHLRGATVGAMMDGQTSGSLGPRDGTLLGALFESLVTLNVRVYAQAAEARVSHFRTQNGDHEVDLVVQRADRRVVAIEVKAARDIQDRDVAHLLWLKRRLGADLLDAIVVSTGQYAYRRPDGIGVVPAALLGI
jgi:uncharacterized protein